MTEDTFRQEVLDLHRYLEVWLKGEVSRGDGHPDRLAGALSEDFCVVHPDGSRGSKQDVVRAFASSHGEKPSGYGLEISDVETRMIAEDICLVFYAERHRGEPGRARISTAILKRETKGGDIKWLFLQERLAPHLEAS